MNQIRIAYDSNLRYLPFVYFLPEDTIGKCSTLRRLPRKVREVMYSDEMMEVVNSDQFLNEIMDAVAALAFPHFGFGGWKEHYTGDSPVWRLSYALPIWSKMLAKEIGWDLQALMNIPSSEHIPFFEQEYVKSSMKKVVNRGIEENNWQPILDAVRAMPCNEDFERWNTNVRKDFIRKWYHTRSKQVKIISLENCMKDEDNEVYEITDTSCDVERQVLEEDYCREFKSRLSERDMKILELRVMGMTYEEIAERLGYKNHSGVLKRMRAITKKYIQYEEEKQQ